MKHITIEKQLLNNKKTNLTEKKCDLHMKEFSLIYIWKSMFWHCSFRMLHINDVTIKFDRLYITISESIKIFIHTYYVISSLLLEAFLDLIFSCKIHKFSNFLRKIIRGFSLLQTASPPVTKLHIFLLACTWCWFFVAWQLMLENMVLYFSWSEF